MEEELEIREYSALKIQSIARKFIARSRIISSINTNYEKIYDPKKKRYYYYNKIRDKSSWLKPVLLYSNDIIKISPTYTEGVAATIIQVHIRMFLSLLKVRLLYQQIIEIKHNKQTNTATYYNPKYKTTLLKLPMFMNNSVDHHRKPPRSKEFMKKLLTAKSKVGEDDNDEDDEDEEEEDEEEEDEEEDDDDDDSEEDDNSETRREKRRLKRRYPRSGWYNNLSLSI